MTKFALYVLAVGVTRTWTRKRAMFAQPQKADMGANIAVRPLRAKSGILQLCATRGAKDFC